MVSSRKTCRLVESWRKLEFGFEAIDEVRNDVSASEPNEVHWMSKLIAAKYRGRWLQVTTTSHEERTDRAKNSTSMLKIDAIKVHLAINQANHETIKIVPKRPLNYST